MAGRLRGRWGLLLHTRQFGVDAGPARRTRRPDGHCGTCTIRIIKAPDPNENQVRPRLRLAEQGRTACGAKAPMHLVATVRDAREISRLSRNLECCRPKASSNRSTPGPQVLAIAAPANARSDRRFLALPTNRTAKASASECHRNLPRSRRQAPSHGKSYASAAASSRGARGHVASLRRARVVACR